MKQSKEKDLEILNYNENKYKELSKKWKKFEISQEKIDVIEAKELKYSNWKNEINKK